jgi:hypothetical protein
MRISGLIKTLNIFMRNGYKTKYIPLNPINGNFTMKEKGKSPHKIGVIVRDSYHRPAALDYGLKHIT